MLPPYYSRKPLLKGTHEEEAFKRVEKLVSFTIEEKQGENIRSMSNVSR